jgi:hypothetical protein
MHLAVIELDLAFVVDDQAGTDGFQDSSMA